MKPSDWIPMLFILAYVMYGEFLDAQILIGEAFGNEMTPRVVTGLLLKFYWAIPAFLMTLLLVLATMSWRLNKRSTTKGAVWSRRQRNRIELLRLVVYVPFPLFSWLLVYHIGIDPGRVSTATAISEVVQFAGPSVYLLVIALLHIEATPRLPHFIHPHAQEPKAVGPNLFLVQMLSGSLVGAAALAWFAFSIGVEYRPKTFLPFLGYPFDDALVFIHDRRWYVFLVLAFYNLFLVQKPSVVGTE